MLATGQKVIVFTAFTDGLKKHKAVLGAACVTLSGDDGPEARMAAVDAFQIDPDVRVIVANLIAGGVGITLTAGTHVIFQDLDWVPANLAQAEDRAYRLGQPVESKKLPRRTGALHDAVRVEQQAVTGSHRYLPLAVGGVR